MMNRVLKIGLMVLGGLLLLYLVFVAEYWISDYLCMDCGGFGEVTTIDEACATVGGKACVFSCHEAWINGTEDIVPEDVYCCNLSYDGPCKE